MKQRDYMLTLLAIGIAIGYYYCEDILQAEESQLKRHPYFLTSVQFNYIYFSTYFAQFLLLLPVGILADALPIKTLMIGLIVMTIIAQSILVILLRTRCQNYVTYMYIVRGVFGISGLGIITIQGKLINRFSKRHYEYIMGLCLNIPYIFTALNSFVTASVQQQTGDMPLCFLIGTAFCGISLIFGIIVILTFLENKEYKENQTALEEQAGAGFSFQTIKDFSIEFWVLILSVFFTEGSINPVIDNLSDYISRSFGIQLSTVGMIVPILFICLTPFSMMLGKIIELYPAQKRNIMIGSRLAYFIALILLLNIPQTDAPTSSHYVIIVFFLLIMSFNWAAFHSILEPGVAYYANKNELGTAMGVMGSAIGLTQCVFSLMNISVTSSSKSLLLSYSTLIFNYIIVAGVSVALAVWVRVRDYSALDRSFEESGHEAIKQENQEEV